MKIAFVTTQSLQGSTVVGRVLPLAEELAKKHSVHILVHHFSPPGVYPPGWREGGVPRSERGVGVAIHEVGADPFIRTFQGKKRLRGVALITRLKLNIILSAFMLVRLKPDVIIIVKSLPENVLATWLYIRIIRVLFVNSRRVHVVLDIDDFELTANQLTSWLQRAAIHWAERAGSRLAHHIVVATPFLADHFEQLTQGKKKVTMIPTGIAADLSAFRDASRGRDSSLIEIKNSISNASRNATGVGKSYLIYAGSISLSSGHRIDLLPDILAEVRREFPEIQLHIHGTGDDVETLKQKFAEKNLTNAVTWHGRFSHLSLRRRGDGGEVYLDPIDNSITARAKSSFRVALAASLGTPVVTSDIGIRPYLLPDSLHARCFAKPADAADYAAKAINWIRNPLNTAEQQALRMHAEQHTWLRLATEYEKIIAV